MQINTELQPLFSYSFLPIILLLVILLLPIIFLIYKKFLGKKKKVLNVYKSKDINMIKYNYLNKLNDLEKLLDNQEISSREAYQELSLLIREFVYELTGIEVQTCTLQEIKYLNIPILYELISEYYDPEFSKVSKGNIKLSIEKTKGVIGRWN